MFICFEGIDGSGKSTQARLLVTRLEEQAQDVLLVREPGGTRISDSIRHILLDNDHEEMDERAESLLYLAARAQLVTEKIVPALKQGFIVISDRYTLSTFAYQGYGRGIDLAHLIQANDLATGGLVPDMTIILDIDPKTALKRREHSGNDRIESAGVIFQEKVRTGYLELAASTAGQIEVVDAARTAPEVEKDILDRLTGSFPTIFASK